MASFFRWRIADKVIPFLSKNNVHQKCAHPSVISSLIRVSKEKGLQPQLYLPWKKIRDLSFQPDDLMDPKELVTCLKNQGLPTAEGFTDIAFCQYPQSIVFTVDEHVFSKFVLTDICANDEITAKSSCLFQDVHPQKIVIECSVPPIGDPFRMTHFRSAIHSNFIANINKMAGHEVIKIMHVADSGLISAVILTGYKQFGIEEELLKHPIQHLFEVSKAAKHLYEIDVGFKNKVKLCFEEMKQGNLNSSHEWNYLTDVCVKHYNLIYEKIGLTFDDTLFDSSYSSEISKIQEDLVQQNLVTFESDGRLVVNVPSNSDVENSFMSYETSPAIYGLSRNIWSAIEKKNKYNFDEMYYVTSTKEKYFLSVLFSLIKELGFQWSENLYHVQLKDIGDMIGKKKNLNADRILAQAKSEMLIRLETQLRIEVNESVEQMAEALSLAALLAYDMKHKRKLNYEFHWNDILSFERNSGASLQLCHAGLKGLQEDSGYEFNVEIDTSPLLQADGHNLVRHLSRFDEIVHKSYTSLEPCFLLEYLFSLWYFVDRASNSLKLDIKEERLTVLKARIMLLQASLKVLQKGLHLLGITPFETNYTPPDFIKR